MLDKMITYFDKEAEKLERDIERGLYTPLELFNNATMRCFGVANFCLASGDVSLTEVTKAYNAIKDQLLEIFNMTSTLK